MQRAFTSLFLSTLPLATLACLIPLTAEAQIVEDGTTSTIVNQDGNNFIIDQGDRVGDNLFHSFNEFSVPTMGSAAFNNAGDIANIFSRVTGSNISNIDGLISANGTANLFLINPNGIIFGQNASLNLGGSFFASTADSLLFEGDVEFSAVNPQAPPLLEVSIPIGARFRDNPGDITNQGNLAVEQDFTLSGGNLDVQGQLQAGGDLTLQAIDTVRIRDSVDNPFIAAANGKLLVQGNQNVDIFALNHPNSGLFSGGDLVLRSANTVSGDAHYWSGGNFQIEQLDGNLGDLSSPNDPVIRSLGDVSFNSYLGSSLHILAGGSVNIGSVAIEAPEIGENSTDFVQETVELSNGAQISIDGSIQPTLDVRAGVEPTEIGSSEVTGIDQNLDFFFDNNLALENPLLANASTSADITIDFVAMTAPSSLVFLTNEYQPNTSLTGGAIQVGEIRTDGLEGFSEFTGSTGSVFIDSRDNISVTGSIISQSDLGNAGDITLLANRDITISNGARLDSRLNGEGTAGNILVSADGAVSLTGNGTSLTSNVTSNGIGPGGNVDINARSLSLSDGAFLDASTFGEGNSGNISIQVQDSASFSNTGIFTDVGTETDVDTEEVRAIGKGGNIDIQAKGAVYVTEGSLFRASTFGQGDAGSISIRTDDSIIFESASLLLNSVFSSAVGDSGGISLEAKTISLSGESRIHSDLAGVGNTGEILIKASDSVSLVGSATPTNLDLSTSISSRIASGGIGSSSNIVINTGSLDLSGAQISTSTFGMGNAGRISIQATEVVFLERSSIFSTIGAGAIGDGDGINVKANSLSITDSSQILSIIRGALGEFSAGRGNAGDINLDVDDTLIISGVSIDDFPSAVATSVDFAAVGNGGDIKISAGEMLVNDSAVIRSALDGDAAGQAGNISIQADLLSLDSNAQLVASTFGQGDAGSIFIQATDSVFLTDSATILSNVGPGAVGNGSEININAKSLSLTEGAQLRTLIDPAFDNRPSGRGNAGNVNINVQDTVIFDGVSSFDGGSSGIQSNVSQGAVGNGGDISILAKSILVTDSAELTASTSGEGIAGNISLIGTQSLNIFDEARVAAESNNGGTAGGLSLKTEELTIADAASVSVSSPSGLAGNLDITANFLSQNRGQITAETGISERDIGANINLEISDIWRIENESLVSATAFGDADGGNININTDPNLSNTELVLLAFPPTGANGSDIIANADRGDGGRINIRAAGVFGIEFREDQTPLNDFTVTSEFGQSGETIINRTFEDPTSGLIELPQAVGDASDQISQNPCQQGVGSEFIITGKGGFPANPNETLNSDTVRVGLVEPLPNRRQGDGETGRRGEEITVGMNGDRSNNIPPETSTPEDVPAMGWIFNDKGEVTLTAYSTTDAEIQRSRQEHHNTCSSRIAP